MKLTEDECTKAVESICILCHEKHELKYGHEALACAFRAFDNEDCPKIKVLKKLIIEYFELAKEHEVMKSLNDLTKACEKFYTTDTFFQHIIKALSKCEDDELRDYAIHCLSLLKQELSNPPLHFGQIEDGMWVWNNYTKEYMQVRRLAICFADKNNPTTFVYDDEDFPHKYEYDKFYRKQVQE